MNLTKNHPKDPKVPLHSNFSSLAFQYFIFIDCVIFHFLRSIFHLAITKKIHLVLVFGFQTTLWSGDMNVLIETVIIVNSLVEVRGFICSGGRAHYLRGDLLNYQFAMNLLLWKVSNRNILKTRRLTDKIFAHVGSIAEAFKSSKSQPYLTRHVTRIEKSLKLKRQINQRI